jgi:hypothetical protein
VLTRIRAAYFIRIVSTDGYLRIEVQNQHLFQDKNGHTTPTLIDYTHALNGFENSSKIRDTEKLKGSFTLWQK